MEKLTDIIADGYNMRIDRIDDISVVISIGGSEREFALAPGLAEKLNCERIKLGGIPLMGIDMRRLHIIGF